MAWDRRTGEGHWTTRLRDQKNALRMSFRAWFGLVMPAKRLLNLMQDSIPFGARLALPEKNESLTTYTAMDLGISARAPAKYLHFHASLYARLRISINPR